MLRFSLVISFICRGLVRGYANSRVAVINLEHRSLHLQKRRKEKRAHRSLTRQIQSDWLSFVFEKLHTKFQSLFFSSCFRCICKEWQMRLCNETNKVKRLGSGPRRTKKCNKLSVYSEHRVLSWKREATTLFVAHCWCPCKSRKRRGGRWRLCSKSTASLTDRYPSIGR